MFTSTKMSICLLHARHHGKYTCKPDRLVLSGSWRTTKVRETCTQLTLMQDQMQVNWSIKEGRESFQFRKGSRKTKWGAVISELGFWPLRQQDAFRLVLWHSCDLGRNLRVILSELYLAKDNVGISSLKWLWISVS